MATEIVEWTTMSGTAIPSLLLLILNFSYTFTDICIKSVFLHSTKPLNVSNKLFCIVRQNENVASTKVAPFRTISHFRKYVPSKYDIISSPKEGIIEVWEDEKLVPFEYPTAIFSDHCAGTAPLPLSRNISIACTPQWNVFDEEFCNDLKYLNVSYYLRKYSTKRNGNRTIVSLEGIPEKSHLIRCLRRSVISAIVHKLQQFYQFDAIFIEISPTSNGVEVRKQSLGYDMGQVIRIRIESAGNVKFAISSGMECNTRKQQINVRLGIQINTACRLRITTCAQITAQIQELLNEWNELTVYSLPYDTNETVTLRNERMTFLTKMNERMDDESCELATAASIQFAYVRFGNMQSYSHRLVSMEIELSKSVVINLSTYPFQYLYFNFIIYFIDQTVAPIQLFARAPTLDIALPFDFFYPFFTETSL
ncbi:unnamed protein product [Litomosoides sigmodontis]|uniref:Tectonic domain-containing protein n=1 Tax=Litomosoides sigmodontis TaxID=42156 RepID=A0A3P6VF66_LITSI|nr:unnamed protein product [Litomosoides sigmodontis]